MLEQLVCVTLVGDELVIGGKKGELYLDILGEREKMLEMEELVGDFFSRKINVRLKELNNEERRQNHTIVEKKEKKESDLTRKIKKETVEHKAVRAAMEIFNGELEGIRVLNPLAGESMGADEKEEEL